MTSTVWAPLVLILALQVQCARIKRGNRDNVKADREVVEQDGIGSLSEYASEHLKDDREAELKAIGRASSGVALQYDSEKPQSGCEVLLKELEKSESASDKTDAEVAFLKYMNSNGYDSSVRLKDDRECMLKAVSLNSAAFEHVSDRLKGDCEVLLKALDPSIKAKVPKYASEIDPWNQIFYGSFQKLKDNRECMLKAVALQDAAFEQVSDRLKADCEVLLKAMEASETAGLARWQHPPTYYLEWVATDKLKDDRECMLKVMARYNGKLLGKFSDRLKGDPEVVIKAMERGSPDEVLVSPADIFFYHADNKRLKDNPDFMLKAFALDDGILRYASDKLKDDPEFMLKTIAVDVEKGRNSGPLWEASTRLRDDRAFMLKAIALDEMSYYTGLSARLQNDPAFKLEVEKLRRSPS